MSDQDESKTPTAAPQATPAAAASPAAQPSGSALPEAEIARLTDEIVAGLKTVYDPEIPADIYELGLIYKIDISDNRAVTIDMTLDHAELSGGAGAADHGRECGLERARRRRSQG